MGKTSSLGSLGSKMQTGRDQLPLFTLYLGLIVINPMFWRFTRDKIWWAEERGCKKEERSIKWKAMLLKTPDWSLVSLIPLGGIGCPSC